jgi:hypothetical protein
MGKPMARKKHSKQEIIDIIRNLAKQIGEEKLTLKDVALLIPKSSINYHFGNCGNAFIAAGLKLKMPSDNLHKGIIISNDELFDSLYNIEIKLGHIPTSGECNAYGKYSTAPFKRFGKWEDVIALYRQWKTNDKSDAQVLQPIPAKFNHKNLNNGNSKIPSYNIKDQKMLFYGEPIEFRGLRHAPINEQGVVYLFGMVSKELGFIVESIQQGFPDCEGKILYDQKKGIWAKARIEFEFKAATFKEHGHDINNCDFIICWINDWADCPIGIIELKSEILKLPSK